MILKIVGPRIFSRTESELVVGIDNLSNIRVNLELAGLQYDEVHLQLSGRESFKYVPKVLTGIIKRKVIPVTITGLDANTTAETIKSISMFLSRSEYSRVIVLFKELQNGR